MSGYIRQSTASIQTGLTVEADPINVEYNTLASAFSATTGHRHDGTPSEGAPITVVGPTQNVYINTTTAYPRVTDTVSLGTSVLKFKDLHLSGTINGGGSGITGINASNISTGTLAEARLPASVVLTSRTIAAGSGLTGGGALSSNLTINVGAGSGISVGTDTVAVDSTVIRTTTDQSMAGHKVFTGKVTKNTAELIDNSLSVRRFSDTGGYRQGLFIYSESAGNTIHTTGITGVDKPFIVRVSGEEDTGTFSSYVFSSTGTLTAPSFSGVGSGLTTLNASALSSGTVPEARIPDIYLKLTGTQSVSGEKTFSSLRLSGNLNAASNTIQNLATPTGSAQAATKGYVDDLVGTAQTWQDVSGSRSHSTSYQNTTGAKIEVSIRATGSGIHAQVSSNNTPPWVNVGTFIVSESVSTNFSVPPGHYYRINGTVTINYWSELR